MSQTKEDKIEEISKRLKKYINDSSINIECANDLDDFWDYLKKSEVLLIKLMDGNHPQGSMGNLETGPALYLLNRYLPWLKEKPFCLPKSNITPEMLERWNDKLKGNGVVYNDGTIFSYDQYCQFDIGWYAVSLVHYIELKVGLIKIYKPFPNSPQVVIAPDNDSITIAIAGDWGSGYYQDGKVDCPSKLVMDAISNKSADFTIHLGDVYYAGTQNGAIFNGEEQDNFVDIWKAGSSGSFTLNSNHEMYDGANGLFKVALGIPGKSLFSLQQGNSFFALTYKNWVIIGLDSGYYDTSSLYMEGSIGNTPNTEQSNFINGLDIEGKQVIVLTHHVGIQFDGTTVPSTSKQPITLWDQVASALGQGKGKRYPDYWYYGHVHNGVAYNEEALGVKDFKTPSNKTPMMRCNGHSALPFGKGYGLLTDDGNLKSGVDYMAHTKMPNPNDQQGNRVLNGFATIKLSKGKIIENFYEVQSGEDAQSKWTKTTSF